MIPVSAAWQEIVSRASQLEATPLSLSHALGRVLRHDARAESDSPPFDASAMDGYALRRVDIAAPLQLVGTSAAGAEFTGTIGPGQCVRIFTGAPIPAGADCVAKQEDAVREGQIVRVRRPDGPDYIRRRGENRRSGDVVVPAGTKLGPPELAALASVGIDRPEVTRAPRCVHLVTGNELVGPEQPLFGAQIRDSNSTLIAALLASAGVELGAQTRVADDLTAAAAALESMPAHDILLISGGAGAGDHDIARPLLETLAYSLHFAEVNLRPGKPLVFASRGTRLAFVLPGNPVSHWVVFQLFIAPLLRLLQTGIAAAPETFHGRLAANSRPLPADTRQTFWPGHAVVHEGNYELTPLPLTSSGDSCGLVGANALLPVPTTPGSLQPGQFVDFIPCP